MSQLVYLNGEIVDHADAKVSVEDRGYQFGDGIYEVIRVYNSRPFELGPHFARLRRSAEAIRLEVDTERLQSDALELLRRQDLPEATIYVQVTRGTAPRNHPFPSQSDPAIVMLVKPASRPSDEVRQAGVRCITVADDRWARCYIKSTNLLANVLAKQQAVEAGCYEALYIRDGFLMEGSSSNAFVVFGGALWTAPKSNYILGGITRDVVLELARQGGIPVRTDPIPASDLPRADEVMISSTTAEILPVVEVDGRPIGTGRPGPVNRRLIELFDQRVADECGPSR